MRNVSSKNSRLAFALTSVLATLSINPSVAVAQDAGADSVPGEIIVTAQRKAERLQNVPIAMTALSGDTLANQGVTDLQSLSSAAPSLNVVAYPNSSDTLTLTMRGQGAGDVGQITRDGGVGLYMDGFYIGRPQGALLDLGEPERIEVLRGPQGTLYGRNTTGGAINIISSKPTGEWGGTGSVSTGSRNLVRALGSVDLPSFGNFSAKGSIVYVNQDGWAKNVGGQHDFGEFDQIAGRISTKWTPSDDVTFYYAFDMGRVRTTPLYYVNPSLEGVVPGYTADRDRTYAPLDLDYSVAKFVDHQLTAEFQISDSFTLRSLTAYRGFRATQDVNYGVAMSTPEFIMTFEQDHYYRTRQYSQEVQLVGDITDRLDFNGGLYWYREKGIHRNDVDAYYVASSFNALSSRTINALSKSYAAYAQSTWTPPVLDDRLKLTAGGRFTRDERSATRYSESNGVATELGVSNKQKFSNFSPMGNIAMEWTRDLMTYVKFAKGYKAGGSAEGAPDFTQTFGPEKVTAWEAGLKSQLFNRMLTFNITAFYNKFDDMQIDFIADPYNTTIISTSNAGKANIKGIEIDSVFKPSRDFSLHASFSYMKSKLQRVNVLPGTIFDGPYAVGDNIAGLFTLPFVPKYSYSVGGDWTFLRLGDEEFSVHGNYAYQSRVYTSSGSGPLVPGREFNHNDPVKDLNARLTWSRPIPAGKELSVSFFVDNLLNNRRRDFTIALGGTPLTGYQTGNAPYNEPRTFGGELKVKF